MINIFDLIHHDILMSPFRGKANAPSHRHQFLLSVDKKFEKLVFRRFIT